MQKATRLKRELEKLSQSPPPGIACCLKEDCTNVLEASLMGLKGSPYELGVFKIEIQIPDKYPFEPPHLRFVTPVYHPNIDVAGRVCLDLLKLPPKGSWRPVITISGLLTSIQMLLSQPNPDDPLMADIAEEYLYARPQYDRKARDWTKKYASQTTSDDVLQMDIQQYYKVGAGAAVNEVLDKKTKISKLDCESKDSTAKKRKSDDKTSHAELSKHGKFS